ncbi:MAG: flagellar filament capping protein FliD [Peptostreptococcales bacterium]
MVNRITGMTSGLDTDALVKAMVSPIQTKADNAYRDRQYAIWQQECYRDVIKNLQEFQSNFLDVLKRDHYLMSEATFNSYTATVQGSSAVTAVTTGTVIPKEHTLSNIIMAQKDTWESNKVSEMLGTGIDLESLSEGDEIGINLDGKDRAILLNGNYSNVDELVQDLQSKIDLAFGAGKITVHNEAGEISFQAPSHEVILTNTINVETGEYNETVENLGFESGDRNVLSTSRVLGETNFQGDIFQGEEDISFLINGVEFTFNKDTDTLNDILNEINQNDKANVRMYYSKFTDTFVLESKEEGQMHKISFTDIKGSFFENGLGMNGTENKGNILEGRDATFELDGISTSRSSNNFNINGLVFTLKENTTENIKISVDTNTQSTKDTLVKFVDEYNKLIDKLNTLVNEERFPGYNPLLEEQKESMSEKEIELWEQKAKSGILRSDDTLQKIIRDFRMALTSHVSGLGISMHEIGISTGSNVSQGGKLTINEEKLDKALKERPHDIMKLFTDSAVGIAGKLKGIVNYSISFTGEKGVLLKKAGWEGTTSEQDNILTKKIKNSDKLISNLLTKLAEAEERHYRKFANMEKILSSLYSQSSWLTSMFNSGN